MSRFLGALAFCFAFASLPPSLAQTKKPKSVKQRPAPAPESKARSLFDGKSLGKWKRTEFSGGGEVRVDKAAEGGDSVIVVESGSALSGFNWTGEALPKTNYELTLEAIKLEGNDFFCGATFPVGESAASLILGGWGGSVVGVSNIDDRDASENDTTQWTSFEKKRWYKVKIRVTPAKIEAWLDDKRIVNQDIAGKKISLRIGEISRSLPLGFATYQTKAAFRSIKLLSLESKAKR